MKAEEQTTDNGYAKEQSGEKEVPPAAGSPASGNGSLSQGQEKERPASQVEELTDLLKRTQANFENYRKQSEQRMQDLAKQASREIITQLFPLLDLFEFSLKHTQHPAEFLQGMKLVHEQFLQLLDHNQVKIIETKGKMFDPYCHEALLKEPSEQPENTIIEEYQKGFTLNNKVIRHARVKISAGPRKENGMPQQKKQEMTGTKDKNDKKDTRETKEKLSEE